MKITKEEKALIKAIVNLEATKYELSYSDAESIEYICTGIIGKRTHDYRYLVEDYIKTLIEKLLTTKDIQIKLY